MATARRSKKNGNNFPSETFIESGRLGSVLRQLTRNMSGETSDRILEQIISALDLYIPLTITNTTSTIWAAAMADQKLHYLWVQDLSKAQGLGISYTVQSGWGYVQFIFHLIEEFNSDYKKVRLSASSSHLVYDSVKIQTSNHFLLLSNLVKNSNILSLMLLLILIARLLHSLLGRQEMMVSPISGYQEIKGVSCCFIQCSSWVLLSTMHMSYEFVKIFKLYFFQRKTDWLWGWRFRRSIPCVEE